MGLRYCTTLHFTTMSQMLKKNMDTGIDIDNETNTRHCKNLQQSQSHSVEQIFAPWLKKNMD